jgi:hydroxymethylpyrimidine pyrophosphatase-like HAD family hydrolase
VTDRLPRRLLAVDLDGTLLDPRGAPHEADVKALRALAATKVSVSIVTGRLYSGTRRFAELLGLKGPVACVDGSHVVDAADHSTLLHRGISGDHALSVRDALARSGAATFVFARDAIVHDDSGSGFLAYVSTWSTDVRRTDSIAEHPFWSHEEGVTAAVAVGSEAQVGGAADSIVRRLGDAAQVARFPIRRLPGAWGLVVRAAGGSKGAALRWLAAHHGCEAYETVCVGDWLNDVSMFEVAGRSFAMGHAPDEVKRAATDVLEETGERGGGVARAIERAFGVVADD